MREVTPTLSVADAVTVTGPVYGLELSPDCGPASVMVAAGAMVSAAPGTASTKSILVLVPPVGDSTSWPLETLTRLVCVEK